MQKCFVSLPPNYSTVVWTCSKAHFYILQLMRVLFSFSPGKLAEGIWGRRRTEGFHHNQLENSQSSGFLYLADHQVVSSQPTGETSILINLIKTKVQNIDYFWFYQKNSSIENSCCLFVTGELREYT